MVVYGCAHGWWVDCQMVIQAASGLTDRDGNWLAA